MAIPMATNAKMWTLAELHSLPDDGNTYELVRGELFVTPPRSVRHEEILARLARIVDRFAAANDLGYVYRPRAVIEFQGSQVEPDLMVRRSHPAPDAGWASWPAPLLVVEIISPTTRRRDLEHKKSLYIDAGVDEYWIVDPESRNVRIVRSGVPDRVETVRVEWRPLGLDAALSLSVDEIFASA